MNFAKSMGAGTTAVAASLLFTMAAVAEPEAEPPESPESGAEETMTLKGGEDGTSLGDLTIRGEDRIRIEFERPVLSLDLDPREAAGLDWGDPTDVLQRSGIDVVGPLPVESVDDVCPFLGRPWLDQFRSGGVAKFQPSLKDVDRWRLVIADSQADTVASFDGKGEPPKEIVWDGRTLSGEPMLPGVTCSYVLEAWDKAGNRRNFVGSGFELPAYRITNDDEMVLMFSADGLPAVSGTSASLPPVLSDVASWLNQTDVTQPIDVKVTAGSFNQAKALAESFVAALRPRVLGDPGRLRALHDVRPDAPEGGTVAVIVGS